MKTLLTLLLATILSSTAFAYGEGRLTITVAANKDFHVIVDGRQYNGNDNTVTLNNIQPGNHTIRVVDTRRNNGRNNSRRNSFPQG